MTEPLPLISPPDTPEFQAALAAQMQAADPFRSAWVEANAGSGKTKVLIDRVARLLLSRPDGRPGAEPDSILCITYTKAAANEMLSRLFDRLGRWSTQPDETLRDTLAQLEGRPASSFDAAALDRARSLFARALETPGGLRIETIHAFCARILRRFPLEAGVPPGFQEIEEAEANQLWREAVEDHLEEAVRAAPDALHRLSEPAGGLGIDALLSQLQAARADLLSFAQLRRKSGKTANELVRGALGIDNRSAEEIAAETMRETLPLADLRLSLAEIRQNLNPDPSKDKASRKLAATLEALLAGMEPDAAFDLYLNTIAGAKWDWPSGSNPYSGQGLKTGVTADLFRRKIAGSDPEGTEITRMKAALDAHKRASVAERTTALLELALPLVQAYEHIKRARNVLDFEDLILSTRHLFLTSGASQWVLYKLDGGLNHVLLDEAQDTSPAQWDLINALIADFHAGLGAERRADPRTQFVVGDPKQSIYSFQGADQVKFEAEKTRFEQGQTALGLVPNQPNMAMSFRSSPEVLDFVDTLRRAAPLDESDPDTRLPPDADLLKHEPRRADQPGRVEFWPLTMPIDGNDESAWIAPTDHVPESAPTRRLARDIANAVRDMIEKGETVWRETVDRRWHRDPVKAGDVLILVRRRSDLFENLIGELKSLGIPVAGADRLKLTENLAVQDCLNLMRFALQPADDLALAEILRGPFCNLLDDDAFLFPLAHGRRRGETLWQRLQSTHDDRFAPARSFCELLIESRHVPAFQFLSTLLDGRLTDGCTGWTALLRRFGTPAKDPVEALLGKALAFDQSQAAGLLGFLSEIETDSSDLKRELGGDDSAVRVMTVHGAKGLQAPVVILPDTTSATRSTSRFLFTTPSGIPLYAPSSRFDCPETAGLRAEENAANERESRRLLYVATTRAQDRLIICGAGLKGRKAGFESSSWYRWCLRTMSELTGQSFDPIASDAPLAYGAPVPCAAGAHGAATDDVSLPDWIHQDAPEAAAAAQTIAPSQIVQPDDVVLKPFGEVRARALQRGRRIHELLQRLPHVPPSERTEAANRFLRSDPDLGPDERAEIVSTTLAVLESEIAEHVFSTNGRSEVPVVGPLPDGRIVNGRIDRMVLSDDFIELIDFKSDRPAPEDASGVDRPYRAQLAAYAHVIRDIYPEHKIRCGLLYTDGPKLFMFDDQELSESLTSL